MECLFDFNGKKRKRKTKKKHTSGSFLKFWVILHLYGNYFGSNLGPVWILFSKLYTCLETLALKFRGLKFRGVDPNRPIFACFHSYLHVSIHFPLLTQFPDVDQSEIQTIQMIYASCSCTRCARRMTLLEVESDYKSDLSMSFLAAAGCHFPL